MLEVCFEYDINIIITVDFVWGSNKLLSTCICMYVIGTLSWVWGEKRKQKNIKWVEFHKENNFRTDSWWHFSLFCPQVRFLMALLCVLFHLQMFDYGMNGIVHCDRDSTRFCKHFALWHFGHAHSVCPSAVQCQPARRMATNCKMVVRDGSH